MNRLILIITLFCTVINCYSQKVKKTNINYIQEYYPELLFQDDIKTYLIKINYNDNKIKSDSTFLKNSFNKINFKLLEKVSSNPDLIVQFDINAPEFKEKFADQYGTPKKRFINKIYVTIKDKKGNFYLKGFVSELKGVNATFSIDESDISPFPFLEGMRNNGVQCCNAINSIFNYKSERGSNYFYYLKGDVQLEGLTDRIKNNMQKDSLFIKPNAINDSLNNIKNTFTQLLSKTVESPENKIKRETIIYNIAVLNLLLGNHEEYNLSLPQLKNSEEKDFYSWPKSDYMINLYNNKIRYDKFIFQKQNGKYDPYYYPIYESPYNCQLLKKSTTTAFILTKTDTIKCEFYTKPNELHLGKIEYTIDKGKNKLLYNNKDLVGIVYPNAIYLNKGKAGNAKTEMNKDLKGSINYLYYLYELIYKSKSIELYKITSSNEILLINNSSHEFYTRGFPSDGKISPKNSFIENIKRVFPSNNSINQLLNDDYTPMSSLETYFEIIKTAEGFASKDNMEKYFSKAILSQFNFD